jgi:hypothetical protein
VRASSPNVARSLVRLRTPREHGYPHRLCVQANQRMQAGSQEEVCTDSSGSYLLSSHVYPMASPPEQRCLSPPGELLGHRRGRCRFDALGDVPRRLGKRRRRRRRRLGLGWVKGCWRRLHGCCGHGQRRRCCLSLLARRSLLCGRARVWGRGGHVLSHGVLLDCGAGLLIGGGRQLVGRGSRAGCGVSGGLGGRTRNGLLIRLLG